MSLRYYLDGTEIAGERIWFPQTGLSMTQAADGPQTAVGGCVIDDPDGDWDITGWKPFAVEEDACSVPRMWTGFVAGRSIGRGSHRDGAARVWNCDLLDLNVLLSTRMLRDASAKRPAETEAARITWLLGSHALDGLVFDNGLVNHTNAGNADEADFRGQFAYDVLGNLGWTARNGFVYWDPTADPGEEVSLYWDAYDAANRTSTLRISNDLADIDDTVTFAPYVDAELKRDPSDVYSGVLLRWRGQETWAQNTTTLASFIDRDFLYSTDRIGRAATAATVASQFLTDHSVEGDTISCTLLLPRAKVNLLLAGDRVSVKFTHLPGYESFGYARVVRRTVRQGIVADFYEVDLELKPGVTGTPPTPPDLVVGDTYENTSTGSTWGWSYLDPEPPFNVPDASHYGLIVATIQASVPSEATAITYTYGTEIAHTHDHLASAIQLVGIAENNVGTGPVNAHLFGNLSQTSLAVGCQVAGFISDHPFVREQYAQATSSTVVLGADPSAGSLLIMSIAVGLNPGTTNAIPDQAGWTPTNPQVHYWTTDQFHLHQFYRLSDGSEKTTAVDAGGNANVITSIIEYSMGGGGIPIITTSSPPLAGAWVYNEIAGGDIDAVNTDFTTAFAFVDGTLHVRHDGFDQSSHITAYDGAAGTFTLDYAPSYGSTLIVEYQAR